MSGIINAAAKYAHGAAVSMLAHSEIKAGSNLPDIPLKAAGNVETADVHVHSTTGKIIIVSVGGEPVLFLLMLTGVFVTVGRSGRVHSDLQ